MPTCAGRAVRHGRKATDIKFISGAGIITGKTDKQVAKKLESYRRLISVEGRLAHSQSGIDFTKYPRTERLADIIERKDTGFDQIPQRFKPGQTIGEVLDQLGSINYGRYFVAGTPSVVADAIEQWLDEDDLDGINLVQYHSFDTARDFIELVVPELRRRGRFRAAYNDGETLRERFFGPGCSRLPDCHFGARYRDPAALRAPAEPLCVPPKPAKGEELSMHEFREKTARTATLATTIV